MIVAVKNRKWLLSILSELIGKRNLNGENIILIGETVDLAS